MRPRCEFKRAVGWCQDDSKRHHDSNLSADQERSLAEIVRERFGGKLSYRQFVDCVHLLCEDIAGFETGNVYAEAISLNMN